MKINLKSIIKNASKIEEKLIKKSISIKTPSIKNEKLYPEGFDYTELLNSNNFELPTVAAALGLSGLRLFSNDLLNAKKGGKLISKCGTGALIGKVAKLFSKKIKPNITLGNRQTTNQHFIDLIFKLHPELALVGTKKNYESYISKIFPNSKNHKIVWHGSNSDFSNGFKTATKTTGSGSPNMVNDFYFGESPSTTLQYVNGVNVIPKGYVDEIGRGHWNSLHWIAKEIMGKGRYNETTWQNIPWEKAIRKEIKMKNGRMKPIQEYKDAIGMPELSDEELFTKVLGFKKGESFNHWKKRNKKKFDLLEQQGKIQSTNPAVVDVRKPYIEQNMDTYYHERPIDKSYDSRYNQNADNEFHDDVTILLNHPEDRIHWLGTLDDINQFKLFINDLR